MRNSLIDSVLRFLRMFHPVGIELDGLTEAVPVLKVAGQPPSDVSRVGAQRVIARLLGNVDVLEQSIHQLQHVVLKTFP